MKSALKLNTNSWLIQYLFSLLLNCSTLSANNSVEEIHTVGTVNNVETSYFTQLKICYLMTMFRCPSDIFIASWLFTARWSRWSGNHLVPRVAELVGSCIPIHARQCLPGPKCLFYPSGHTYCVRSWRAMCLRVEQELSYRKQIARQLRTQYVKGIYRPNYPVTLKSKLRVTQGHWKRNHWVDITRLTISRFIWRWILSWPWNVG